MYCTCIFPLGVNCEVPLIYSGSNDFGLSDWAWLGEGTSLNGVTEVWRLGFHCGLPSDGEYCGGEESWRREGEREEEREGGREGGREGEREREREGGREGGRGKEKKY